MARAESIAGQERRSLLVERPSLPRRILRLVVLVGGTVLLFTGALAVVVVWSAR